VVVLGDEEDDGEGEGDRQDPRDDRPSTAAALPVGGDDGVAQVEAVLPAPDGDPGHLRRRHPRRQRQLHRLPRVRAWGALHCTVLDPVFNCFLSPKVQPLLKRLKVAPLAKNPIRLYGPKN